MPTDPVPPAVTAEAVAAALRETISVLAMVIRERGEVGHCQRQLDDRLRRALGLLAARAEAPPQADHA